MSTVTDTVLPDSAVPVMVGVIFLVSKSLIIGAKGALASTSIVPLPGRDSLPAASIDTTVIE